MGITLEKLIEMIEGKVLTPSIDIRNRVIEDGYVSDLLSDVMSSAKENQAWITIMKHLNSIAVASLINLPCIIFAKGIKPEEEVINKAQEEDICLISSNLTSFEIAGKLYSSLKQTSQI
jgi:serine kinase of HPr protein (carbohydrate metabolism regulator)